MKRLSFALPDETLRWLHREARRLGGISIGELLRRLIDEKRDSKTQERPAVPNHQS